MAQNNNAPLRTPAPTPVYNPESGGSHMDIEPLDPRQGQPVDATVSHAMDTTLPDVNPQIVQPKISPAEAPGILHADPGTVAPGAFKRPGFTGVTKT